MKGKTKTGGKPISKKRIALVSGALVLLVALVAAVMTCNGNAKARSESAVAERGSIAQDPESMQEVKVTTGKDEKLVEATGNLEAVRSSDLVFPVSGKIASISASEGLFARKGQALARLDDLEQRYQLRLADTNLESARISGSIREAELYSLEREYRAADLEKTVLRMPYDGYVSTIASSSGDMVGSGTVVMTVFDRSSLVAELSVDEIDLPSVKVGQTVTFEIDALPGKAFRGKVLAIPLVGAVSSEGIVTFAVKATIENPPEELLPGFSFAATIVVVEPRAILSLPEGAVRKAADGYVVLVKDGTSFVPKRIEARELSDGSFELLSGLSEGDSVWIAKARTGASGTRNGLGLPGMGGFAAPPEGGPRP